MNVCGGLQGKYSVKSFLLSIGFLDLPRASLLHCGNPQCATSLPANVLKAAAILSPLLTSFKTLQSNLHTSQQHSTPKQPLHLVWRCGLNRRLQHSRPTQRREVAPHGMAFVGLRLTLWCSHLPLSMSGIAKGPAHQKSKCSAATIELQYNQSRLSSGFRSLSAAV